MRFSLLALPFLALPLVAADIPQPAPTKPTEPVAKQFSAAKAGEYLDGVGVGWTRERKCITCHTNMPYLTARPLIKGDEGRARPHVGRAREVRCVGLAEVRLAAAGT